MTDPQRAGAGLSEILRDLEQLAESFRKPGYMSSDVIFAHRLDPIVDRLRSALRAPQHDKSCISLTTTLPCDCELAPHRQVSLRSLQEGKEIAVCQRCKQPVHWHKIKCHYDCTECGHINGSAVLLTLTDTVVDHKQLLARVENYLGNGGFFNPELMEHDKVRALVMDLAAALSK